MVPGKPGPAESDAGERREAVAEGEESPARGREVETVVEEEDEGEDDEGVEEDADRVAAGPIVRAEEAPAAEARQDEEVERQGRERAEGRTSPVEPPEEEREGRHPDVDGLPLRLGRVEGHARAASARSRRCSSRASVKCLGASPVRRS